MVSVDFMVACVSDGRLPLFLHDVDVRYHFILFKVVTSATLLATTLCVTAWRFVDLKGTARSSSEAAGRYSVNKIAAQVCRTTICGGATI